MEPGVKYDDYMEAYLNRPLGFDLTEYTNTNLSYVLQYELEANYDYFYQLQSYDGFTWDTIRTFTDYGGWEVINIPITSGSMFYVKFIFSSDNIISDFEGVYLDDIEITGDPVKKPNLTYNWFYSPSGSIVISNEPGTNIDSYVYGGEPTYIDLGIMNDGDTTTGSFTVNLDIDYQTKKSWTIPSLAAYSDTSIIDFVCTLSTGSHNIDLIIDPLNQVDESDELDNDDSKFYTWYSPELSFTGRVWHINMNPAEGTSLRYSKNVIVDLMDKTITGDRIIAKDTTDEFGNFGFYNISNTDSDGTKLDIFLKIYAENNRAFVASSYNGNITTDISPIYNDITSAEYDTTIYVTSQNNGAFFLAQTVLESAERWFDLSGYYPGKVQVVNAFSGTGFLNEAIYIDKSNNPSLCYPDTYDKDVIYHEYGHYIESNHQFFDNNTLTNHSWFQNTNPEAAASEGWATFWSAVALNKNTYFDYCNNFNAYSKRDLENGEYGTESSFPEASVNNFGSSCEGAIAGIFWDIYDNNNDDYSTLNDTSYPNLLNPDGIGDNLNNQQNSIFNSLLGKFVDGHHPDNIDEFRTAWLSSPSNGYENEIDKIFYEHGILYGCCVGIRGNIDNSQDGLIDVGDIVYLVTYMFAEGPEPVCVEEANVDGSIDGLVDISDLVYLAKFMFSNPQGPEPYKCLTLNN